MNRIKLIIAVFCLTIIASIWWYRAIKGSMTYKTISELLLVLLIALVVSTIISILYLIKTRKEDRKKDKKGNKLLFK